MFMSVSSRMILSLAKRINPNQKKISQLFIMSATSPFSTQNLHVEHDSDGNKFFIKLDKDEAKLEYVKHQLDGGLIVLDMWHTEVPPNLQGKGIAKILAKAAFDYAVDQKFKMQLSCTYLQKYYADNPLDKYKLALFQG